MATAGFYVYEHRRLDTGAVFYVGKGSGGRLKVTQHRSPHWNNVAKKAGWTARVLFRSEDEELVLLVEQELIRRRRMEGAALVNLTDGGEGMSGYAFPPDVLARRAAAQRGQKRPTVSAKLRGRAKSPEHRAKLAESHRGMKASPESRARMSASHQGRAPWNAGKRLAPEHRAAISRAVKGELNPFFGRRHRDETIIRLSEAHQGFRHSEETKRLMSESRRGHANPRHGVLIPEDQKARQVSSLKARPLLVCPHCGKSANEGNARRWHFNNCRRIAK